jgi:hypothetical protein
VRQGLGSAPKQGNAHPEEQFLAEFERAELGTLLYVVEETFEGVDSDYLYSY